MRTAWGGGGGGGIEKHGRVVAHRPAKQSSVWATKKMATMSDIAFVPVAPHAVLALRASDKSQTFKV